MGHHCCLQDVKFSEDGIAVHAAALGEGVTQRRVQFLKFRQEDVIQV